MAEELKACPFCGGKAETVQFTKKRWTVECFADGCGAGIISQGDMQTAIAAWNNRAQLPSQGGEAVEVVAHMYQHEETGVTGFVDQQQVDWGFEKNNPRLHLCGELMTVAQHQRILAAATHPADQVADDLTMVKASRELLEQIAVELEHDNDRYFLGRELRALLAAASPQ